MKILTDYLGEIEFNQEDIIQFPDGIYGFPESRTFIMLGEMTPEFPFVWLQSTTEEEVTFILTNPFLFVEAYDFELSKEFTDQMKIDTVKQVDVYSTVIVKEAIEESTLNLKSPIIINKTEKIARQVILNEDYPYKHLLFKKSVGEPC